MSEAPRSPSTSGPSPTRPPGGGPGGPPGGGPGGPGGPPPPELQQFFDLLISHFRFQFMAGGVECDLFTILDRSPGLDRSQLMAQLGLAERPCRVLLLGCASLDLVRREGDKYFNSPLGKLLSKDHPMSKVDFVKWERLRYRAMAVFPESLKQNTNLGVTEFPGVGETLYERVANNPDLRPTFHKVMGAITEDVAALVVNSVDFGKYKHILDVGGGAAAVYGRAITRRWPHVRITILDLPSVAELARKRIADEKLERIDAVGLDCLTEEFPKGADCILFSHFLEMWSSDRIRELIKKAGRAVDPGGDVLIVTPSSEDDETGPWISAHLAAYFQTIATSEGMVYTAAEFESWMRDAGLQPGLQVRLPMTFFIEGRKAG